jgi:hypothetical protein
LVADVLIGGGGGPQLQQRRFRRIHILQQ